ncbi:hypothetical protein [Ilumatobacter sp.]|uniref:hypothetical protein n=1 Tax=Ilumatobacter sp. TaxID=1967498 RepID=UPI003C3277D9
MAFVNKQGGEQQQDKAAAGQPIDFDPDDTSVVKVHYDLSAWSFDHRAELAEALADAGIPHYWDEEELVVPEVVEADADAMFEQLEALLGPFPVGLADDDEAVEYGLDEWSDGDRSALTAALVEAEIPHRWDGAVIHVAADAESDVDSLLDAIEAGELGNAVDEGANEPPDGVLGDIFLTADKLAKDPFDAKARRKIIDLDGLIEPKYPPYQLAPRVWSEAVAGVAAIVDRIVADAEGGATVDHPVGDDGHLQESSDVIGLAQELRSTIRDYV